MQGLSEQASLSLTRWCYSRADIRTRLEDIEAASPLPHSPPSPTTAVGLPLLLTQDGARNSFPTLIECRGSDCSVFQTLKLHNCGVNPNQKPRTTTDVPEEKHRRQKRQPSLQV